MQKVCNAEGDARVWNLPATWLIAYDHAIWTYKQGKSMSVKCEWRSHAKVVYPLLKIFYLHYWRGFQTSCQPSSFGNIPESAALRHGICSFHWFWLYYQSAVHDTSLHPTVRYVMMNAICHHLLQKQVGFGLHYLVDPTHRAPYYEKMLQHRIEVGVQNTCMSEIRTQGKIYLSKGKGSYKYIQNLWRQQGFPPKIPSMNWCRCFYTSVDR